MERIVDGILFEGEYVEDTWDVRTWEANGVMERSARQVIAWREIGPCNARQMTREEYRAFIEANYTGEKLRKRLAELEREEEEARERSLKKSAQRAKQMCRRIIIAEGFDQMLTITYRENQEDRDRCKAHFKEWVRRVKRALGGEFRYCASFERQERGAMHVHVACHKLPKHVVHRGVKIESWRLGTEVWRSIVGRDNGLVFVGGRNAKGNQRHKPMSLARMAQYVSKYILKDYEESPAEKNRYSRSNGVPMPKPQVMRLKCSLRELIDVTFEQGQGDFVVSHRLGRFLDSMWLVVEKAGSRGSFPPFHLSTELHAT